MFTEIGWLLGWLLLLVSPVAAYVSLRVTPMIDPEDNRSLPVARTVLANLLSTSLVGIFVCMVFSGYQAQILEKLEKMQTPPVATTSAERGEKP